jgi:hypothetical protein
MVLLQDKVSSSERVVKLLLVLILCFACSIYITSSGDFCTPVLKFVGEQLGYDRLMFSLD